MNARTGRLVALTCATVVVLAGCGPGDGDGTSDGSGADGNERTLDVLAAASLTETFQTLADRFEETRPGVDVRLVLESSTTLATQVNEGAPADVLATADETSMQLALDAGTAGDAHLFATNQLVLAAPPDNPGGLQSFEDLDEPGVSYVACAETTPCGALSDRLLSENGIETEPVSLEVDVKAVLAKVVSGEVDAGLVYLTDAFAARGDVTTWPVPGADEALNPYFIAVVEQADDPELAAEWIELVLSEEGQEVLARVGFGAPDLPGST